MKPLKEVVERDGQKYAILEIAPVSPETHRVLLQAQRKLKAQGFSCLVEREFLRGREVYKLLRSLRGEDRPAIPEEVTHD